MRRRRNNKWCRPPPQFPRPAAILEFPHPPAERQPHNPMIRRRKKRLQNKNSRGHGRENGYSRPATGQSSCRGGNQTRNKIGAVPGQHPSADGRSARLAPVPPAAAQDERIERDAIAPVPVAFPDAAVQVEPSAPVAGPAPSGGFPAGGSFSVVG